jgi:hypothetical protein
MATRPIFSPLLGTTCGVKITDVDFVWVAGMSLKQKCKNILCLHESAKSKGFQSILEISTKSEAPLGRALSAFNLKATFSNGKHMSVECAFQGSKVFANGGAFVDIYNGTSLDAKRDERLKASGDLRNFDFSGEVWPLEPTTAFYDWLYLTALTDALRNQPSMREEILVYDGFTDIEFNPQKSFNCQAKSVALWCSLVKGGYSIPNNKEDFLASRFKTISDSLF